MQRFRPWREAMADALYGPGGFFLREAPARHFRTSVTTSPLFAAAVRRLAGRVDDALGRPDPFDLVDLGAGRGELLTALPEVPTRWRLTAVELAPDPGIGVRWGPHVPALTGLLVANEWLDNVPVDVLEHGRLVEVAPDGAERPGDPAGPELLAWSARWWPGPGRVEVGLSRDRAWAGAVSRVRRGLAVAVDYGHTAGRRRAGLTGYLHGAPTSPVPDGSCDLTAPIALDSCAAATGAVLLTQRQALGRLGVSAALPEWDGVATTYAAALQQASQARTLLDPTGLGGLSWLARPVGIADPLGGAGDAGRLGG